MTETYKPNGKWKCLACGTICDGEKLFLDPQSLAKKWTCSDLFCGGTCVPLGIRNLVIRHSDGSFIGVGRHYIYRYTREEAEYKLAWPKDNDPRTGTYTIVPESEIPAGFEGFGYNQRNKPEHPST